MQLTAICTKMSSYTLNAWVIRGALHALYMESVTKMELLIHAKGFTKWKVISV